jgi:hypothetical protein
VLPGRARFDPRVNEISLKPPPRPPFRTDRKLISLHYFIAELARLLSKTGSFGAKQSDKSGFRMSTTSRLPNENSKTRLFEGPPALLSGNDQFRRTEPGGVIHHPAAHVYVAYVHLAEQASEVVPFPFSWKLEPDRLTQIQHRARIIIDQHEPSAEDRGLKGWRK